MLFSSSEVLPVSLLQAQDVSCRRQAIFLLYSKDIAKYRQAEIQTGAPAPAKVYLHNSDGRRMCLSRLKRRPQDKILKIRALHTVGCGSGFRYMSSIPSGTSALSGRAAGTNLMGRSLKEVLVYKV